MYTTREIAFTLDTGKTVLVKVGLTVKGEYADSIPDTLGPFNHIKPIRRKRNLELELIPTKYNADDFPKDWDSAIEFYTKHLGSRRIYNPLLRKSIFPSKLFGLTDQEIVDIRNIGSETLNILAALRDRMRREGPDMKPIES